MNEKLAKRIKAILEEVGYIVALRNVGTAQVVYLTIERSDGSFRAITKDNTLGTLDELITRRGGLT
jgi:hypothetical protein